MNQPPYGPPPHGENIARRPGMAPWMIVLIVLAGCGTVGVAVIAVLAAILFPVFAQAREAARRTSCMSNAKQLSTGLQMYIQDYDEHMPPAASWGDGVYPYVKNNQVYVCPSRPELSSAYAFNGLLDRCSLDKVTAPASAPMIFESSLGGKNGSDQLQSFVTPHRNVGHIAYVDGHVKSAMVAPSASTGLAPLGARKKAGKR